MSLRSMFSLRWAVVCVWAIAIIACIAVIGPSALITDYNKYLTPHGIHQFVLSYGDYASLVYIAMQALRPFSFLPATPFTMAGGYIFGHYYGLLLSTIGTTIAATISFFLSRYLLRDRIKNKLDGRFAGIGDRIGEKGIFVVIALRLIPILPFDAVSYLAGVSSIRYRNYIVGTILGELPGAFIFTMLGSSLKNIRSPYFIASLALAVIFLLLPIIYKQLVKTPVQNGPIIQIK